MYLLALATIVISNKIRQIYYGCIKAGYIPMLENMTNIVLLTATAGINCPIKSDSQISIKIPIVITISNLLSLIVVPSDLVSLWQ